MKKITLNAVILIAFFTLVAFVTLSLTSCLSVHTYRMSHPNPFGRHNETIFLTVDDFGNYKVGDIVQEGAATWRVIEVK